MSYPILKFEFNKNYSYDNTWFHAFWFEDYFGNILSKEKYRYAKSFNGGYAFVYKQDKTWDIINAIGESQVKKFKYSKLVEIAFKHISAINGFFIKNYKIDSNLLISVSWPDVRTAFSKLNREIKYAPEESTMHGYLVINIDTGRLSFIEDYSLESNGLIAIKHFNKSWSFIELQSFRIHALEQIAFNREFEFSSGFQNGLAKVKSNGYFGFINTKGDFVIEPIFDDARSFYEGYAAVAIANCRDDIHTWNKGKRYSDLAWNFIDKTKSVLLKKCTENLSMIDLDKSYYYKNDCDSMYSYEMRNLNPDFLIELRRGASFPKCYDSVGRPFADFWYSSKIWGQLYPHYIVDFLTAQICEELGFKRWFVKNNDRTNAYGYLQRASKVTAESIYIDFDTTLSEHDFINDVNSLQIKYGNKYTSGNWKSKKIAKHLGTNHLEIDWSNYNDDLDMDQQSIDFWNQF